MWNIKTTSILTAVVLGALVASPARAAEDLESLREQAIKGAMKKIGPSVVTITTSGGTDIIVVGPTGPGGPGGGARIRKGTGPTTGLVVSADGYIITSAFNFANKPNSIFVAVAGHKEKYVATVVCQDETRMLTLLKIDTKDLIVPPAVVKKDIKVGFTSLAIGRTLSEQADQPPSVSEGIISATGRIWGKAIQTDAKLSPTNYGGPLIDLEGNVMGVIVPASSRSEGETSGFEWYDSGIGFAIPLEDINAALPRMKTNKTLTKGVLGVTMSSPDMYSVEPKVATVSPNSAADVAGIKAGDLIKEIDGVAVANYAQVLHQLGNRYKDDEIKIKLVRDQKEMTLEKVKLGGAVAAFGSVYLGILPMRDDAEKGVEVRYVYPKSPAEEAKLAAGDRIVKYGAGTAQPAMMEAIGNRDDLARKLAAAKPNTPIKLEIIPKGAKEAKTITVTLKEMPETVPSELPEEGSKKKALGDKKKEEPKKDDEKKDDEKKGPETGLIKERMNRARDHKYWIYVPDDYDENVSYALMIWLHPAGKNKEKDIKNLVSDWEDLCSKHKIIMVGPGSENDGGWIASEVDFVLEAAKSVMEQYTIDKHRVVAHGMGIGGQLSLFLGFSHRDLIRGVATVASVPNNTPKERVPSQPLSFFIVTGDKDPIKEAVKGGQQKLIDYKYPVIFRELKDKGHQYFDSDTEDTLKELARWIDSIDRL